MFLCVSLKWIGLVPKMELKALARRRQKKTEKTQKRIFDCVPSRSAKAKAKSKKQEAGREKKKSGGSLRVGKEKEGWVSGARYFTGTRERDRETEGEFCLQRARERSGESKRQKKPGWPGGKKKDSDSWSFSDVRKRISYTECCRHYASTQRMFLAFSFVCLLCRFASQRVPKAAFHNQIRIEFC